jgi:Uma2 family endonuclease
MGRLAGLIDSTACSFQLGDNSQEASVTTKQTTRKKRQSATAKEPRSRTRKARSTALEEEGRSKREKSGTDVQAKTRTGSRKRVPADGQDAKKKRREPNAHARKGVSRRSSAGRNRASGNGLKADVQTSETPQRVDHLGARIAAYLFSTLDSHARTHGLGRVTGPTHFDWGDVESPELCPDIAFVSFDRWAPYRHVPSSLTWHVVPDLVVEILRESGEANELDVRLNDYFKAGVNRVWMVRPHEFKILDYQSPSDYRTLQFDECIDGGALLQGFQLPLREVLRGTDE